MNDGNVFDSSVIKKANSLEMTNIALFSLSSHKIAETGVTDAD